MKMAVSCTVAPCSLVDVYRRFRGACCVRIRAIALIMEVASKDVGELLPNYTSEKTDV
jgi:hypothetical protein